MNFNVNLPSWAITLGYSLQGRGGTYDSLELWKNLELLKVFTWRHIPNVFEIEDLIREVEKSTRI